MFTTTSLTARSRALVSAALVAAGVLATGVASAGAEPTKRVLSDPAPFSFVSPADRERMERQVPLIAAADAIEKAAEQQDHGSGYTSIELGDDSVIVHWKGAVPRVVREAIGAARRDVPVEVKAAEHSRAELDVAEKRIQEELLRRPGPDFSVEIPADGSGVVVSTEGRSRTPSAGRRTSASASPSSASRSPSRRRRAGRTRRRSGAARRSPARSRPRRSGRARPGSASPTRSGRSSS